jgi:cell division protein FtsN
MTKDYKHRVRGKNTLNPQDFDPVQSLSVWRWMLITASVIVAVVLLLYFSGIGLKAVTPKQVTQTLANTKAVEVQKPEPEVEKPVEEPEIKATQFDFYTILAEKEAFVPDYEIKTLTREEQMGQAKVAQYIIQVGSYNNIKEAEQMRAKLNAMGIESNIQKATVNNTIRYRVKLGPFTQIGSVNSINARLKQNGIDAMVTRNLSPKTDR